MNKELRDHIRASRDAIIRTRVRTPNLRCQNIQTLKDSERVGFLPEINRPAHRITSGDTMLGSFEG